MSKKKIISLIMPLLMLLNVLYGIPITKVQADEPKARFDNAMTWQQRIFGSGVSAAFNTFRINDDNSITIDSTGNAGTNGKISNNADGIAFYYTPLDAAKPFQITAKAHVEEFVSGNNQVSFGLMLRNTIGENEVTKGHTSNFVAVGALNQKMQAFYRTGTANEADANAKLAPPVTLSAVLPKAGDDYILSIIKTTGNKCIVSYGPQTAVIDSEGLFTGDEFYLGLFTARNTRITFSDIKLVTAVSSISVSNLPSKTDYIVGQTLDLDGLKVLAAYSDGSTEAISPNDFTVTGYDGSKAGKQTLTVNYGGRAATFDINVNPLACTSMKVFHTPAKTTYYIDDQLDTFGIEINGTFNSGEVRKIDPSEYTLSNLDSSTSGEKTITAVLNDDKSIATNFKVTVLPSKIQDLEIRKQPVKTLYYLGDKLDLDGLVISASYIGGKVILQSGEYTVDKSGFDTDSPGQKTVVISFKGKEVRLPLTVKVKEAIGIAVTTLPKTTYYTGDSFDPAGMVISKLYDNLDNEAMFQAEYTIDSSALRSDIPGVYNIGIIPADTSLKAIFLPVTVREQTTYTWKSIEFGQSTKPGTNTVEPSNPGTADGTIKLTALEGGGKVTGAHDGISFYYTEIDAAKDNFILSADIKVNAFAKESPDNQEAFGLMARDAIGKNGDSSVFSSNIVAVGGYKGTTQAFMRTGVKNSSGNEGTVQIGTAWKTPRPKQDNTYPAATYRLTLAKTNTGYTANLNDSKDNTVVFYEPDILNIQDSKIYVGFYTARLATIEVSNVSFSVTASATDAPRVLPPQKPVAPALNAVSLQSASKSDYTLKIMPNVNGTVTIKQGETVIASDVSVAAKKVLLQKTSIPANSDTNFTLTFTPDVTQTLTSYDRIVSYFTVTMKTYETADGAIFVSPSGKSSAAGTREDPLDLDTAVRYVKEGQTIYMLGGTYNRTTPVSIPAGNDGTPDAVKTLAAYNGETVTIDFGTRASGFALAGSYWHLFGIDFTGATSSGLIVGGNYNKIELCDTYANANTGMTIGRIGSVGREAWPSNNLILNCESYDNKDASENNADGFAAKINCGEGNVFRGCISHNNIDDGWDLYTKAEVGPIGAVVIENCIAYNGGVLTNGYVGKGDKNGFKLGGEGIAVPHIIRNSIAFGNGAVGFTSNSNPAVQAYNCVSFDNAGANISFSSYENIKPQFKIDNFVSYRSKQGSADRYPSYSVSDGNYFNDGTVSANKSGIVLDDSNFASLTPSIPYKRDEKGNIIRGDFLKFIAPKSK